MNQPESLDAWEWINTQKTLTSWTITGVYRLKQGKKYIYFVPYGIDYECEGGHYIECMTQEEFDKHFSLTQIH